MFLRVLRSTKSQRFRYEYKSITRSCSSKNGDNDKPGSKSCDKTSDSFKSIIDPSSGHNSITDGSLSPLGSKGKHLYHEDCENGVNCQILAELNAAYAYLSMACFFGNIGVSLPGCANFFRDMFDEEIGHAKIFIDYQNLRGGMVKLRPISVPDVDDWGSIIKALEVGLEMEKAIKEVCTAPYLYLATVNKTVYTVNKTKRLNRQPNIF